MTFKEAFEKNKLLEPDTATYILLCKTLQESGANYQEIKKYFESVMSPEEYDPEEKEELIAYLVTISTEFPD